MRHRRIRPPPNATQLEVIEVSPPTYLVYPDRGVASFAIVGLAGRTPTVWHGDCFCGYGQRAAPIKRCPVAWAMEYCARKYGAANGCTVCIDVPLHPMDDLDRAIQEASYG